MISYTIHFCWGPLGFIWRMSFSWLKRFAHLSLGDNIFRFLTVIYYKQNDGHSLPTTQWKKYSTYLGKYKSLFSISILKLMFQLGVMLNSSFVELGKITYKKFEYYWYSYNPLIKIFSKLCLRIHCGATGEIYFVHFMPFVPYPFW